MRKHQVKKTIRKANEVMVEIGNLLDTVKGFIPQILVIAFGIAIVISLFYAVPFELDEILSLISHYFS